MNKLMQLALIACLTMTLSVTVNSSRAQVISTVAGNGIQGNTGNGGPAINASIDAQYLTMDPSGNMFLTDYIAAYVRMVNTAGIISIVAGNGLTNPYVSSGIATATAVEPTYLAVDGSGNVYFDNGAGDAYGTYISKLTPAGVLYSINVDAGNFTINSAGTTIYYEASVVSGTAASINSYSGGVINHIAGSSTSGFSGDGGPATNAQLNFDGGGGTSLAIDATGNLFIVDGGNYRIRKINTSGIITTIGGNGTAGYSGDGGPATNAKISPVKLTVDISGNIYFTDATSRIRKINTSGIISTIAGTGTAGFSGDGGSPLSAMISDPRAIFCDASGRIYFSDLGNNRIRKIGLVSPVTGASPLCAGGTITLSDITTGGAWTSGNTAVATISSGGVVTGIAGGTATITYTASGDIATTVVTVNPRPTAAPTSSGYICNGGTVSLMANGANGASAYTWTGPGLSSNVIANPTATPTATATYSLTVSSGSAPGCSPTTNYATTITVSVSPTAAPTASGAICSGVGSITLSAHGAGGASSYNWRGPAGWTSALTNPSVTPGITSTYSLTVSSGPGTGCSPATVYTVIGYVTQIPDASPYGTDPICLGATMNLFANDDYATSYLWTGSSLSSTVIANPTATPNSSGSLVYTVRVSNACGSSTYSYTATVLPAPSASVVVGGPICAGGTLTLLGRGSGGVTSYRWAGPNLSSTTVANPTATPSVNATYSLTVTNGTAYPGCSPAFVHTVNAYVYPTPTAAPTNDGPICAGSGTSLHLFANGSNTTTYNWTGPNLTATNIDNPVAIPTASATYYLTVSSGSYSGCSPSTVYRTDAYVETPPDVSRYGNAYGATICQGTTAYPGASMEYPSNYNFTWSGPNITCSSTSSGYSTGTCATPSVTSVYTVVLYSTVPTCTSSMTATVTVNPMPIAAPTSTAAICSGGRANLFANGGGGATSFFWIGPNLSSNTGANPTATPTVTSVYSLTVSSSTCSNSTVYTTTVTVQPQPTATISNNGPICSGGTVNLSTNPGASTNTFSWTGPALSTTTAANPTAIPTATAVYTLTAGSTIPGCTSTVIHTTTVTVNPMPVAAPTSNGPICSGGSVQLHANPAGGATGYTWAGPGLLSTTTVNTTANPTSSATYSLTVRSGAAPGCSPATVYTTAVTVYPAPSSAPGNTGPICMGGSAGLLANGTPGTSAYLWSGPNLSGTSIANPTATPTVTSVYSVTATGAGPGCSIGTVQTTTVTVNSRPSATPSNSGLICGGGMVSLFANASAGANIYSWSGPALVSTTAANPTATPATTTAYTLVVSGSGSGCTASPAYTTTVTVNPTPTASPSSDGPICNGNTVHLAVNPGGGATSYAWSGPSLSSTTSLNPSATPTVTAVYSVTVSSGSAPGCAPATVYTTGVTVNNIPLPAIITGLTFVSVGGTTTLSDAIAGGTWNSSTSAIASVSPLTGVVTGVSPGTCTIYYTLSGICGSAFATTIVDVAPSGTISPIAGTNTLCAGATASLSDATPGGAWSSTDITVASIGTNGVVTGVSTGTSTISYNVLGVAATTVVTISGAPIVPPVIGTSSVCVAGTTTLFNGGPGGTWSSGNTAIATVDSFGSVTGVSIGTCVISFTMTNTCGTASASKTITVISLPAVAAVAGPATLCFGATTFVTDVTPGGFWFSSNSLVATVSSAGLVTGVSAGPVSIAYAVANACGTSVEFANITVTTPAPISGSSSVCAGATTTFTNPDNSGTWSSSSSAVATVDLHTGIVTGIRGGTATISYVLMCGTVTRIITVLPSPDAGSITGGGPLCQGNTLSLGDAVPGGNWSSSNTAVATVGTAGIISGITGGNAIISYSVSNTCGTAVTIHSVVVNVSPGAGSISGVPVVSVGSTTLLSDTVSGGTWNSGATSIATVDAAGLVTGISPGLAIISYAVTGGCGTSYATAIVYVTSAAVDPITGTASVCTGSVTILSDATPGGVWSSSDTAVATVDGTGVVTGVAQGTGTISYTVSGVSAIRTVAVNAIPLTDIITGPSTVCADAIITLSDGVSGGAWSAGNGNATVSAGVVTGVAVGDVVISYTVSNGCGSAYNTFTVTVNPATTAASITGPSEVCLLATITLTTDSSGGVWSSSNGNAMVSGGMVTGVTPGISIVSYSITNGCGTAVATQSVTINPLPDAGSISGAPSVCIGLNTTFTNGIIGGAWSSSNGNAMVSGGVVTGVAAGTSIISYSVTNGCGTAVVTKNVIINTLPDEGSIAGAASVGIGSSIVLTDGVTGGIWTSSNTGIATVTSVAGNVTGVSSGSVVITYTVVNSCGAASAIQTITVTTPLFPIAGNTSLCAGSTTILTDATAGGVWTSSNTAVANIGSNTGIVSGLTIGTTIITYSVSGSSVTAVVSVLSSTPPITGVGPLCAGGTLALGNVGGGGTWTSSNTAAATVDITSGIVTGVAVGTSVISYSLPCGVATQVVSVGTILSPVTGAGSVCQGSSIMLTDATGGGSWSSSNTAIATIGSTGFVTGVLAGTVVVSYSAAGGCVATTIIGVDSSGVISGATSVCAGSTTNLSSTISGGYWSSSNAGVATVICNLGIVKGVAVGTSIISNTLGSGCTSVFIIRVISLLPNVGSPSLCTGTNITYTNSTTGGRWSSSDNSIAVIDSAVGIVTGIAPGNVTIYYSYGNGCNVSSGITVQTLSANFGNNSVCTGSTTTLGNITIGGTWSSSNTSVAPVTSSTGVVSGIAAGTAMITYSFGATCIATTPVIISNPPSGVTVTGGGTYCGSATINASGSGGTIYFQGTTSGGTSIASPSTSQVVSTSGTYYFRALSPSGCWGTEGSVSVIIPTVSGPLNLCAGTTATLTNTGGACIWSSSNPSVATIGSVTGIVTAMTSGTIAITGRLSTGCIVAANVTVGPAPSISGPSSVCVGQMITLTNSGSGGTWITSAPTIATISSTGIVTGVAGGSNATITYSLGTACRSTIIVSVNPLAIITGPTTGCTGQNITLADAVPGGTWSSSAAGVATIGPASGVITGTGMGTAVITYLLSTGCTTTVPVSIKALSPISGPVSVCAGQSVTLSDTTYGGTWSTSAPTIATVNGGNGVVTGVAGITITLGAPITYTLGSGCKTFYTVSVYTLPSISGPASVCQGLTTTLTNSAGGGAWSSAAPDIAAVGSTGVVTGSGPGITNISYTLPTGCVTTTQVYVNPVTGITGPNKVCQGQNITLRDAAAGGTWSTSAPTIATVGSATGIVSGIAANLAANITYTFCTGCKTVYSVSVSPLISISGPASVCQGQIITLADATAGGTWSSSAPGIAAFSSTNGNVTGVSPGLVTVSYSLPSGCIATTSLTINPLGAIAGPNSVCHLNTITLTNATPGGSWTSSAPTIASVISGTGLVTGVTSANLNATISYTTGAGCKATKIVSVIALPAVPATIAGPASVSISGAPITLTDATTGGIWTSSNTGRATVVSTTGVVTGVGLGTVTITYTVTNISGCTSIVTKNITVGPEPHPHDTTYSTITVTAGSIINLGDAEIGGSWSCTDCNGIVSLDEQTGFLEGITPGRATITYTITNDEGIYIKITTVVVNLAPEFVNHSPAKVEEVAIIPNPNNGEFIIKGNSGFKDESLAIEITNMLGQTIYKGGIVTSNGNINERIILNNSLANGMYILNIYSEREKYLIHFVLER